MFKLICALVSMASISASAAPTSFVREALPVSGHKVVTTAFQEFVVEPKLSANVSFAMERYQVGFANDTTELETMLTEAVKAQCWGECYPQTIKTFAWNGRYENSEFLRQLSDMSDVAPLDTRTIKALNKFFDFASTELVFSEYTYSDGMSTTEHGLIIGPKGGSWFYRFYMIHTN